MASMSEVGIKIDNLSKVYGAPHSLCWARLRQKLGLKDAGKRPQALKSINLEVKRGEILGLIGRNGAGKSTLLKMIAGVSPPTTGSVEVKGSVFPMIELNAGMNVSLTGRENVVLLATILGLSPREIRTRMDEIEEFCSLGEWFDRPVRQYSSGMPGRLGFAVAAYSDADILLIDEVLAVGDLAFRSKCMEKMEALRESGRTVVFASHNLSAVAGLCTRTIMMEMGEIRYDSVPGAAVQHYRNFVNSLPQRAARPIGGVEKITAPGFAVHGLAMTNAYGMPVREIWGNEPSYIILDCEIPLDFDRGTVEMMIMSAQKGICVHENLMVKIEGPPTYRRITMHFPQGLRLHPGEYTLALQLIDDRDQRTVLSTQAPLLIVNKGRGKGVYLPQIQTSVSSPTVLATHIPPLKAAM